MALLPRMRPDFKVRLDSDPGLVLQKLRSKLEADDAPFEGQVVKGHACLRSHTGRRNLMSPHLELDVQEEDGADVLRGRFSPQPNVWTGFMALFGIIGMLGLAGAMYGFAQMTVGESPRWLLAAPAAVGIIAFIYGAAFIGQGLSSAEMFDLRAFVQCTVRDVEDEAADQPAAASDA